MVAERIVGVKIRQTPIYNATDPVYASRMFKKASSFVLASLKASTYAHVRLGPSLLRPRWAAFLNILRECVRFSNFRVNHIVSRYTTPEYFPSEPFVTGTRIEEASIWC